MGKRYPEVEEVLEQAGWMGRAAPDEFGCTASHRAQAYAEARDMGITTEAAQLAAERARVAERLRRRQLRQQEREAQAWEREMAPAPSADDDGRWLLRLAAAALFGAALALGFYVVLL